MVELLPLLAPVFLYAETHYRFRYFFSRLLKKEPEIIVDAPRFVEPGNSIPVLVMVKDAHLYPVDVLQIVLTVRRRGETVLSQVLLESESKVADRLWWKVFQVDRTDWTGWVDLDPTITYRCGRISKSCSVDNYKGSSGLPLNVYLASERRVKVPALHYGDCHTHSSYTDDQVEFGAPLGACVELSKSSGLSFFCATDHSYDLDDSVESYLKNDPELPKWNAFQEEAEGLNSENELGFAIIRGEEITCRNSQDGNVHLLLLGDPTFHEGSGDSADEWLKTRSQKSISEVLRSKSNLSVAIAAHPREPVPFLQKVLLGRREWSRTDLESEGLDGIQFINGRLGRASTWGEEEWVRMLLKGKRIVAMAGTDAHGNFNRFRQLGIPFFTLEEHHMQLFGQIVTGVFLPEDLSEAAVLKALKHGNSVLTNGPICTLAASNEAGKHSRIGETVTGDTLHIELEAQSTVDFGEIASVDILCGSIGDGDEVHVLTEVKPLGFESKLEVSLVHVQPGYIRARMKTSSKNPLTGEQHLCITNPIWIQSSRRSS